MEDNRHGRPRLSIAHWAGMGTAALAGLGMVLDWRISILAAAAFIVLCMVAPFLPQFGFFLPVISRGNCGRQAVALTFDDGPDPLATPALLGLLKRYDVRATFFVSGSKVAQYPHIVKDIIQNGHSLGNHSYHHDPFVLFKGREAIRHEIEATQKLLQGFGVRPLIYRPPVGILSPRLNAPLKHAGLLAVNFSCRAFDHGNKRINGIAERILASVRADDIILLHDIMPLGEDHLERWLSEISILLEGLAARGLSVAPLEFLIKTPVMISHLHSQIAEGDIDDNLGLAQE